MLCNIGCYIYKLDIVGSCNVNGIQTHMYACACVILGYCSQKFAFASHYVYPLTANSSEKIYVTLCVGRSKGNSVSFLASGMENCDVHT